MGDPNRRFKYRYIIRAKQGTQIRANSLESARQSAVKRLETVLGKGNFLLRLHKYPHHILRENPLASGAGADRLSTGMKMSFGKPIGVAAQVHEGDVVYEVAADNEAIVKKACDLIKCKLPNSYSIQHEPYSE
jgi:large subunit ribosomal protein L10e